jgi:glycosyltransferase involved in cell wall biosynthesis
MNLDVVTVAHNEEKMIKYFIEHYLPVARNIYILDHESTDNMAEVAKSYGEKIKVIPIQFKFSNILLSIIKAQFSKQLDADFVIACDTDELLFPRNIIPILEKCKADGITVPLTTGYHMLNESFDFKSNIYDIKRAYKDTHFDKKIIFDPKIDIEWSVGQHFTVPKGCGNGYQESTQSLFELRHYKYINLEYIIDRNNVVAGRLNQQELNMGMGVHHIASENEQVAYFQKMMRESVVLL